MIQAGFDTDLLRRHAPQWRSWLELRAQAGSTNTEAAESARNGAAHGACIVADRQSAGRGRKGAPWICPPGEGLAFSVVLLPAGGRAPWSRAAMVAGLAVAEELEALGLEAKVKWPNDVLLGGRKVCGILVEANPEFAVVGIGVNVNVDGFPPAIREIATSVRIELGRPVEREALLVGIRRRLLDCFARAATAFPEILGELESRCALLGHPITAKTSGGPVAGVARGFGPNGELLVEQNGTILRLTQANEIRLATHRAP